MRKLTPPQAVQKPQEFTVHGDTRVDEFAWLRIKEDPAVQQYVRSENGYADATMRSTKRLQGELFREIKARMKEDDMSVPVKDGPYLYYSRTKKGKQYAIHCRKLVAGGKEEVILDENSLAKGQKYFSIGVLETNSEHTLLAYSTDTSGNERYTLFIKDLRTGALLNERIESVSDVEWAEDGQHFLYTVEEHPHPPRKVLIHRLGDDPKHDSILYEERDLQWYVGLDKTRSKEFIFVVSAKFNTTEVRFVSARDPRAPLTLFAERVENVRYFPDHHGDFFYIMTDERAVNFKVMRTNVTKPERKHWKPWIAHDPKRPITGLMVQRDYFALTVRDKGVEEIFIHAAGEPRGRKVAFREGEHTLVLWSELEYESPIIRVTYQSFVTPKTVYDIDPKKLTLSVQKRQDVPGYQAARYESKREWATSGSVKVPITLVYKKTTARDGTAPLFLEAYGAYGITNDPTFSITRQTLLDRGWIIAYAHVRGGGEMGWHWHKQAKLLTKHRTYEDVIACAQHLQKKRYSSPRKTALIGGSAGGMMVGAVFNMRPDLFGAGIAYVPAADLLTSSLDESLGGTRLHYDENGDPSILSHYRYLKKHSPYEGVRAQRYPHLLVRANMNDIRTPYWEAAKWVARLRARKTDTNTLLMKTEIVAGHFGKSGRYEWIKERAFDYAFLMQVLGLIKKA